MNDLSFFHRFSSRAEARLFIVFFLSLIIGTGGSLLIPDPSLVRNRIALQDSQGRFMSSVMYWETQLDQKEKHPGALLCHGISCSKELMDTIGYDLARHGFVVMTFDFAGHGESQRHPVSEDENLHDTQCALNVLKKTPFVDSEKIVLIGHSMGAVSSGLGAAADPAIRGAVCLGQKGSFSSDRPRNFLQAIGLYDQYHTVQSMIDSLHVPYKDNRELVSSSRCEFSEDANRWKGAFCLLVQPDGDHASEVYSVRMIPQIRSWALQSVGRRDDLSASPDAWRVYFNFLTGGGLIGMGVLLIGRIRRLGILRFLAVLSIFFIAALCCAFSNTRFAESASLGMTVLYILMTSGFYAAWRKIVLDDVGAPIRCLWGIGLFIMGFAVGSLIGPFFDFFSFPEYIPWIPIAFMNIIVHRCCFVMNILRADFFHSYTQVLIPSVLLCGLLVLEPLWPGALWRPVGWIGSWVVKRIRQFHFRLQWGGWDSRKAICLLCLGILLFSVGQSRYREGYLTGSSILTILTVVLRMYLLPLFSWGVLIRISQYLSDRQFKQMK